MISRKVVLVTKHSFIIKDMPVLTITYVDEFTAVGIVGDLPCDTLNGYIPGTNLNFIITTTTKISGPGTLTVGIKNASGRLDF